MMLDNALLLGRDWSLSKSFSKVMGAALLITGTCIGAGMLGVPVKTAPAGIFSVVSFFIIWIVMTCSAMLFVEVSLFFPGELNLISLANRTLGNYGKNIAWVSYLLFLYSLMAAYTAGGTTILAEILHVDLSTRVGVIIVTLSFMAPFVVSVYKGVASVDVINRILICGLLISFILLSIFVNKSQQVDFVMVKAIDNYKVLIFALPLLVTSFGYHLLLPSLKTYLGADPIKLKWAVLIGGAIPLTIYIIWQMIILQLVPLHGEGGLISILLNHKNPGDGLVNFLAQRNPYSAVFISCFSFFALASSFLGISLGLFDFFADGLKLEKSPRNKLMLSFLTFVPPIFYTLIYPQGFLQALGYAGIFASVLLIIYPAAMVWGGRYRHNLSGSYRVMGGKLILALIILFGALVIVAEICGQFVDLSKCFSIY